MKNYTFGLNFRRIPLVVWGEAAIWFAAIVCVAIAIVKVYSLSQNGLEEVVIKIPRSQWTSYHGRNTGAADSAFQLLARERESEVVVQPVPPPTPPVRPVSAVALRPVLRGIIWNPTVSVLIEGNGLPEGGAILELRVPRAGYELLAVRGDSAFIKGRDSSWTLTINSRSAENVAK